MKPYVPAALFVCLMVIPALHAEVTSESAVQPRQDSKGSGPLERREILPPDYAERENHDSAPGATPQGPETLVDSESREPVFQEWFENREP